MNAIDFASKLLAPYEPQIPIPKLVEQLNRFFHASEARHYDARHAKTLAKLVPIWRDMLVVGLAEMDSRPLRVLDFGCGTGFEATRLLEQGGDARIERLVCYDPSPEMLEICRNRLARFSCPVTFVQNFDELLAIDEKFDILLTNSLLHHLPDPLDIVRKLEPFLSDHAVWLAGHEPSVRFFRNAKCCDAFVRFQRQWQFRKYLSPRKYLAYAKRILLRESHPEKDAAMAAQSQGLVRKELPLRVVALLIDYHVANSKHEVEMGRGFDLTQFVAQLAGRWQLQWSRVYNFTGSYCEEKLPILWRRKCLELERQYPDDGCNFCAVWKRAKM